MFDLGIVFRKKLIRLHRIDFKKATKLVIKFFQQFMLLLLLFPLIFLRRRRRADIIRYCYGRYSDYRRVIINYLVKRLVSLTCNVFYGE